MEQGEKLGMLLAVNTGKPVPVMHGRQEVQTGIFKKTVAGPVRITVNGLPGDGQADPVNHGGPDKAVCVYTQSHWRHWERVWGESPAFGAFGENFTITDGVEQDVGIGDIIRVGGAVVQVSQPRLPCFKLGLRHGKPELPGMVLETGYTGYYFRVLEEGDVREGDTLIRIMRQPVRLSVYEAVRIMKFERTSLEAAERLQAAPGLAEGWKEELGIRIEKLRSGAEGGEPL
ncbi:MAG TPA: MOSC domain-containing protein [Paenibacillus sp.]|uniref:MOSC domain-containing protein n=1 Tax=Paenibacillus sp. TaxID=58172 RepID=UPI002BFA430D|nr:MOSC domain-containing protein [Paenibacillus sp.]HUC90564.1 MOSC domain-containing protein [Paenibacillus sp.]